MDSELSSVVDAAILGETSLPIGEYNGTNFSMLMVPRRDPLYVVIPMTIIYTLIFVTGVVGNAVTFVVIVRNKYMHTATNYYLFSLAISDLLLLVSGLPQEMVSIWCRYPYFFGEVFCVLRGLSAETSTNASVLTIVAFTVERYVAICHPFLSQTMSKLSRAVKLIIVIWFVALSFAIPQAIQFGIIKIDNDPNQAMCTLKRNIIDHSFVLSSFLFFVTPMTLITVLYVLIGLKLRKSSMIKKNSSFYDNSQNANNLKRRYYQAHQQSSKKVLKMLVAVVVAFFICWAPFHAQRLVYTYGSGKDNKPKGPVMKLIYEIITYVSGILYYVSTTINPLLYHIMSLKFREAFKDTLSGCAFFTRTEKRRKRRTYFILNKYCQRGMFSRRGAQLCDADSNSSFLREDSLPPNVLAYDMTLSKYKYRRKTVSVSEATDDSTRTEITQISQKHESPSRGNTQKRFSVVFQISNLDSPVRKFLKNGRPCEEKKKVSKFWKVLVCIQPPSSPSKNNSVKTEYRLTTSYSRYFEMTSRTGFGEGIASSNASAMIPENLSFNRLTDAKEDDAANETIDRCLKNYIFHDLNEEMDANASTIEQNPN